MENDKEILARLERLEHLAALLSASGGAGTIVASGTATLDGVTGKTPVIQLTTLSGNTRIVAFLKDQVNAAATIEYAALAADRIAGSPGSFQITALTAAGNGTPNTVDISTLDWIAVE